MRGLVGELINFYFHALPDYQKTIGDALTSWSNHVNDRKVRSLMTFIPTWLINENFSLTVPHDKKASLLSLARAIQELVTNFDATFINAGSDATNCARGKIGLTIDFGNPEPGLSECKQRIDDYKECRSKCSIGRFISVRNADRIEILHTAALPLVAASAEPQFTNIALRLKKAKDDGVDKITCTKCGGMGDGVIALNMPPNMRLEHIDASYNPMCDILHIEHNKLLTEGARRALLNSQAVQPNHAPSPMPGMTTP